MNDLNDLLLTINEACMSCGIGSLADGPADPGFRGHGLAMMRELTPRMRTRPDQHGTSVTMTSRPIPISTPHNGDHRVDPRSRCETRDLGECRLVGLPGRPNRRQDQRGDTQHTASGLPARQPVGLPRV
jgi:hypothetical protein